MNSILEVGDVGNGNEGTQESKLTVPWIAVLGLVGAIIGALFLTQINHEGRLVKTETLLPAIVDTQKSMDAKQDHMMNILTEVRQDQIQRRRSGYPEYKGIAVQERQKRENR